MQPQSDPSPLAPPRISVVVPAYNAAAFIGRTLDSLLAQTLAPLEILVVDDGSQDETARIIEQYAPAITLIRQANGGPNAARNHGLRVAQGEWIALCDADDQWLPRKLERQALSMTANVSLVHCYARNEQSKTDQDLTFDVMWKHNFIGTSSTVVRRQAVLDAGGFCEDRKLIGAEDYNLWLRLLLKGHRVATVREELFLYTPPPNSLSQQIARVIQGELLNIDKLAADFPLTADQIRWKKAAIYNEYSRALFWMRDLPRARLYFRELLRIEPSWKTFQFWLATFLPRSILNMRRAQFQT